jgi:hypothetical protein
MACERSLWHLTMVPLGICFKTTQVAALLTRCPPGPLERTKDSSKSDSLMPSCAIKRWRISFFFGETGKRIIIFNFHFVWADVFCSCPFSWTALHMLFNRQCHHSPTACGFIGWIWFLPVLLNPDQPNSADLGCRDGVWTISSIPAPEWGRTTNLQLRRLTLYPIELRAHVTLVLVLIDRIM